MKKIDASGVSCILSIKQESDSPDHYSIEKCITAVSNESKYCCPSLL